MSAAIAYIAGVIIGGITAWVVCQVRADKHARWAAKLATNREHWQYHQGAIDAINALEPKRDAQGRFVAKSSVAP